MTRFLVALTMGLILAASLSAQIPDVTVGVNISTTGAGAMLGIPEKNVFSAFAPSVIAGHKVRWVIYDDASDPTAAVQSVRRLVSEDKVDLVLGPTLTTSTLAVIDVAAESKTPLLSFGSSGAIVDPMDAKRKWIFKGSANENIYAQTLVKHMASKGVKTASVITFDDAYGESNLQEFKKATDAKGIRILTIEKYKRTDTSVTGQVLKAMQGNPDAIYIIAIGTPAALPHLGLVERGYKGKIYQTGGVVGPDFIRLGGKAVEGSYAVQSPFVVAEQLPDGYPTKAESVKFIKAYEPKFGSRSTFGSQAWDALNIVKMTVPVALKKAKPGTMEFREALRDAMEKVKYNGALAVIKYSPTDHAGVDELGVAMLRIENGNWKLEQHATFK